MWQILYEALMVIIIPTICALAGSLCDAPNPKENIRADMWSTVGLVLGFIIDVFVIGLYPTLMYCGIYTFILMTLTCVR